MKNLLFASLKLPKIDRAEALNHLSKLPSGRWFYDSYRTTWVLPLRNQTGGRTFEETRNVYKDQPYQWTGLEPEGIRDYFEKFVFPWSGSRCRITILRTPPGQAIREHIDCSQSRIGSMQHKFRIVLQGSTSSLYFCVKSGRLFAPETEQPFLIDGSWPHGMVNDQLGCDKITVCMGAPWTFSESYPEFETFLDRESFEPPASLKKYFEGTWV